MANNTEILSMYIKKLSHPLKEIRERSLMLLKAKLKLGWELDDELSGTRELLEALLAWLQTHQQSLQREALELLLTTVKTKAGTYIAREFGIETILSKLKKIQRSIASNALDLYDDVIETLRFINSVESDVNVEVPRLTLPDVTSSESDACSSSGYYNLEPHLKSSKATSISNDDSDINRYRSLNTTDSIRILLFPWVELCPSDKKTLLLVEDALRLLKSTRRCCRFIRDVFLRDFYAEIFLNRPEIIKSLVTISDGNNGGRPGEALCVLLNITRALRKRLLQLSSLDLIHETNKISDDHRYVLDVGMNTELQEIAGESRPRTPPEEDGLVVLRQLPAPLYALDTLHAVLTMMARSVVLVDSVDRAEFLNIRDLNICVCLVECLVELLLDCINDSFWSMDHSSKTYRDISHKSCMAMRLMGDLLFKYRKSFFDDLDRTHHRVAWLRLTMCAEKLLHWARDSALPPTSLVTALQIAQLDPAIDLFYPALSKKIELVLQSTRITVNQEYKSKYRELKKLFTSMDGAVQFMNNKKLHKSKEVLACIKTSLPVLELFQSDNFLGDIADILLNKTKELDLNDNDWSIARNIAQNLMGHNAGWVQITFYKLLAEMVKSVLVGEENEKSLTLLCDVGILTEICCHGLSSKFKEVEENSSEIMCYLLRGRLVLSESCWWRLLASLLPVLPLLHVYAAHETQLGKAICKSLERDIADCLGVSTAEVTAGLVRLLFVRCVAVQLDAAHGLCQLLDDERYLPPRDSLRADVLLSALRRVKRDEFNIDTDSSPSKVPQTTGLTQILDVLKQDIILDEHDEYVSRPTMQPALEPSLRRSTLQQLAVIVRQQNLHDVFLQYDGVKIIVATLRMSLMVDDYLAFPECAMSCVSILNSVCFASRHNLAKIPDLPCLLIRVILVFPANDGTVLMATQVLALVAWAGFALQELNASRHRIPALPFSVTQKTSLPFPVNSYWNTSPNAEHSYVEWLLADEEWRTAVRVRWWCTHSGRARLLSEPPPAAPLALRPAPRDLAALKASCPIFSCTRALMALQNATAHRHVTEALHLLESYVYLVPSSYANEKDFSSLPWKHTRRFLDAPPASSRDTSLLCSLLHFIVAYMDNIPNCDGSMTWIMASFIGNEANIISLLSRDQLYPQQTAQETIEVTQLHIHIVKVLLRSIIMLENWDDYDRYKLEILLKILLACLERLDLKNFHILGYLNELMRCVRYAVNSRYCKLSEETLIQCLRVVGRTLTGCTSTGGCKGQACRLDATLSLLALLRQIHYESIPVQRWSEGFNSDIVRSIVKGTAGARAELRAASLQVVSALAHYTQLMSHLLQAIQEPSLSQFAAKIFSQRFEANAVRAAAACLLASIATRASPKSDILECDVLEQLHENNFIENSLEILVEFCNIEDYKQSFEGNVSLSLLERRGEFEVRAQKGGGEYVSPKNVTDKPRPPPTAAVVTALADALHNVSAFTHCPVQDWNERGLYRLLFRCASWTGEDSRETYEIRGATCRALQAVTSHKCVRVSLAATKDCLYNLLMSLTPFGEQDNDECCMVARAQAMTLVASLLGEKAAVNTVWQQLRDTHAAELFHLMLQCLESDELELQDAALYCLTQLTQSISNKKQDDSCSEFYDKLKSPYWDGVRTERCGAGDSARSKDCQPEYLAEEICKALINLYQKLSMENKKLESSQDERWIRVCSCLSSVLSVSGRSRQYAVHRGLPRTLITTLQAVRDHLSMQGKPAEVIKNANNDPVLRTLYWLLIVMDCLMLECPAAKESFVDDNMTISLSRLWPWCMMTDQLRQAVMHLIYTFTNDCPKAWGAMCTCVGGRTLVAELCALCAREASLSARPRPPVLLLLCLNSLGHMLSHHQCRTILLKSEVQSSMYRMCMRERVRGAGAAGSAWARVAGRLARHADGAASLLALAQASPPLSALPAAVRARLMPAVAHAAHHHRITFLQSSDLLELLSGTLLTGDTAEIVSAARAVWALAANNHKAKLVLRSSGVSAAVLSSLQRLQRGSRDTDTQRALQLLTYTNTVLQTTLWGNVTSRSHSTCRVLRRASCTLHLPRYSAVFTALCASWTGEDSRETYEIRGATCRALQAVTSHKCVRVSLAATKDCLYNLLMSLTPFGEQDNDECCMVARAQAMTLVASLLGEKAAVNTVWQQLRDTHAAELFHLMLQCLESDELELQDAALYCLTQLTQSISNKKQDDSCSEFYDKLKSPYWDGVRTERCGAGDSARSKDCQPEYLAEEICKALINLYQKLSMENKKLESSQDERWIRVCSCLSSVLSVSGRSRQYAVHRGLPRTLITTLQAVRDHLSMQGKPAEVIKNANNDPVLRTLYWLLIVMDCLMLECPAAKESFVDDNMTISLSRLWPWCMMTDQLRQAVMHLIYTFTNDCPKAWGAMCTCVGGRTLVAELCALCAREASLSARPRPPVLLLLCLNSLGHMLSHHQCRTILLKSEVQSSMYRMCMRERVRGAGAAGGAWARVAGRLARHADGAASLLALAQASPPLSALPAAVRARLMPAVAHAAHHHRITFLQSSDLLELLSGSLLTGDTAEIVSAARAVWALAANNHKAKLVLRSSGVSAAVLSSLQRLQRGSRDTDTQRALQLLTYTNTVLQTT